MPTEHDPTTIELQIRQVSALKPGDTIIALTPDPNRAITVRRKAEPTPELPTTPYTVIRAWWGSELWTLLTLHEDGIWRSHLNSAYDADDLAQMVRFEVLAEPRPTTAKAVLEYIRDTVGDDYFNTVVSEEFGVEDAS